MSTQKIINKLCKILEKISGDQFPIEASKEILDKLKHKVLIITNDWVEIKIRKPDFGIEVLCFNPEWVNADFNPQGLRVGFRSGEGDFTTAHWWDYQDTYMTISKDNCEGNPEFSKEIQDNTEPTHWFELPNNPLIAKA